uniref:Uncharacterized protein n=1 Tax=Caenorhabditis japonica TaxID=281687 RepID=A0A8R1IBN7_CAEJA
MTEERKTEKKEDKKETEEEDEAVEIKEGIRRTVELEKVFDYIIRLAYQDHVDYQYIYKMLGEACNEEGLDINSPYDWELKDRRDRRSEPTEKPPTTEKRSTASTCTPRGKTRKK